MGKVRAKKKFGQHFLNDKELAEKIVESLKVEDVDQVIELGPGMGVLSEYILKKPYKSSFIEIDKEAIDYLVQNFPEIEGKIIESDFLKVDLDANFKGNLAIIGNFPYNISSQILFKMLDHKEQVLELVGMFQKEVADRVIAPPGSKVYGIISVFVQAYYNSEHLFTLGPEKFSPPPKINSAVIRLTRNGVDKLNCDEKLFVRIVKQTFNQRRKMIRNTLKSFGIDSEFESEYLTKRPEQLSVSDFIELTRQVEEKLNKQSENN